MSRLRFEFATFSRTEDGWICVIGFIAQGKKRSAEGIGRGRYVGVLRSYLDARRLALYCWTLVTTRDLASRTEKAAA